MNRNLNLIPRAPLINLIQGNESEPQSSNINGMIDNLNAIAEAMKAQAEVMKNLSLLVKAVNEVLWKQSNDDPLRPAATDENGEVVIC